MLQTILCLKEIKASKFRRFINKNWNFTHCNNLLIVFQFLNKTLDNNITEGIVFTPPDPFKSDHMDKSDPGRDSSMAYNSILPKERNSIRYSKILWSWEVVMSLKSLKDGISCWFSDIFRSFPALWQLYMVICLFHNNHFFSDETCHKHVKECTWIQKESFKKRKKNINFNPPEKWKSVSVKIEIKST